MMKKLLTRKWNQFLCIHHWDNGFVCDGYWPRGVQYRYTCSECNKTVDKWNDDIPISGIIKDPLDEYKKDPRYNMSPSMIRIDN